MSEKLIDVTCECGRVYVLPAEKEGRKLQCRRCGAIRVVRRDPSTVGVAADLLSSEEIDILPEVPKPPPAKKTRAVKQTKLGVAASKVDLKPLRRCPRCGHQDDPDIVICIRCNFDYRVGASDSSEKVGFRDTSDRLAAGASSERLPLPAEPEPSKKPAERGETMRTEREGGEFVASIENAAKLGFIPLVGLLFGFYALFGSFGGPRRRIHMLPASSRKPLESRLDTARLMAVATILLWLGLVGWFKFIYVPGREREETDILAQRCRGNLELVGQKIRDARERGGRFPEGKKRVKEGLEALVGSRELEPAHLQCPVFAGEPYGIDDLPEIGARTMADHLVLWDAEPHDMLNGTRTYRALRADGKVEEFRSTAAFDKARTRPAERRADPVVPPPDKTPPDKGGEKQPPVVGPKPTDPPVVEKVPIANFEARRTAILQLYKELDDAGPSKSLTNEDFTKRIELAPIEAAVSFSRCDDVPLKRILVEILARLDVTPAELGRIAAVFEKDEDNEVRLTMAAGLKRVNAPNWMDAVIPIATDAGPPFSERALALLGEEAKTGRDGVKRVLLKARERRRTNGASPDQPIFPLPPETYGHVIDLLLDPEVGGEALAVLSRGTEEVVPALEPAFIAGDARLRELSFRALRANLAWRELVLTPFYEKVQAETDRNVKAYAVLMLALAPDLQAVKVALGVLRESSSEDPLVNAARKVIAVGQGKEIIAEVVNELDHVGFSRDEVLRELGRAVRVLDPVVGEVLAEKAPNFTGSGAIEAALNLAANRFDDASHKLLLDEGLGAKAGSTRTLALKLFFEISARVSAKVAGDATTLLPQRLPKEDDPAARTRLFALLERREFRTPGALQALEQVARRTSEPGPLKERAVQAIATFPDVRAVTLLTDLLDVLTDAPRDIARVELRQMTGLPGNARDDFKKLIQKNEAEVKKRLKDRDDKDDALYQQRLKAAQKLKEETLARADRERASGG